MSDDGHKYFFGQIPEMPWKKGQPMKTFVVMTRSAYATGNVGISVYVVEAVTSEAARHMIESLPDLYSTEKVVGVYERYASSPLCGYEKVELPPIPNPEPPLNTYIIETFLDGGDTFGVCSYVVDAESKEDAISAVKQDITFEPYNENVVGTYVKEKGTLLYGYQSFKKGGPY